MRQLISSTYDWRYWRWGYPCLLMVGIRNGRQDQYTCRLTVYIGVM